MDLYSSLDKIKGVGEKTYQKFKDAGINSVSDILKFIHENTKTYRALQV